MGSVACTAAAVTAGAACFCCGKAQQQAITAEALRRSISDGGGGQGGQHGGLWSVVGNYSVLAGAAAVTTAKQAALSAAAAVAAAVSSGAVAFRGGALGACELPVAEPLPVFDSFKCPITQEPMRDPVTTADGQSYERASIAAWFQRGRRTSPLTNNPLESLVLTENVALRGAIAEFELLQPFVDRQRTAVEDMYKSIHARSRQREFEHAQACDQHEVKARELRKKLDDSLLENDVLNAQLKDALESARSLKLLTDDREVVLERSVAEVHALRREVSSLQATIKQEREEAELMAVRAKSQKFGAEAALLRAQVVMLREELAAPAVTAGASPNNSIHQTLSTPPRLAASKEFPMVM